MIFCPECKNEISSQANACPNCGFPVNEPETVIVAPPPERIVVAPPPSPPPIVRREVRTERSFPNWLFVPIALGLVLLVFGLLWAMQSKEETANENINVRINETARTNSRGSNRVETVTNLPSGSADSTVVVPPASTNPITTTTTTTNSTTNLPSSGSETITIKPTPVVSDKGNLAVTASVVSRQGSKKPIRAEKLYLLKKDLNTILREANIDIEEGDYSSTLGAALVDPSRKALLQECLAAIKPFIVASTITGADGKAEFKNVKPDNYYLFGLHREGNTASVWNTNLTLNPGVNTIELTGDPAVQDSSELE